jgi:hypothetical protein
MKALVEMFAGAIKARPGALLDTDARRLTPPPSHQPPAASK